MHIPIYIYFYVMIAMGPSLSFLNPSLYHYFLLMPQDLLKVRLGDVKLFNPFLYHLPFFLLSSLSS